MLQICRIVTQHILEALMTWFWLNMPLAALFFLAWTLIPLWLVLRHPDTGPDTTGQAQLTAHRDHTHSQPEPADHHRTDLPTAA